jgi:Fe(3+) dicitrate transport protein
MIKLFWEPDTERYHRFEAKLGFSELDADETYLGLTDGDFDADFARRYSASRFDNIDSKHRRSYLRHTTELADGVVLSTTAYHNTFYRNWFKLRGSGADLGNAATYACWTGQAACNLRAGSRACSTGTSGRARSGTTCTSVRACTRTA